MRCSVRYSRVEHIMVHRPWVGSRLTRMCNIIPKKLAMDKHSNLFCPTKREYSIHSRFFHLSAKKSDFICRQTNMVEIEKSFKIEIEIYRIEIFRTEIKIGFYRIGFLRFCFQFRYNFGISKNYDSIYIDTKFNRCHFDKYRIVSVL